MFEIFDLIFTEFGIRDDYERLLLTGLVLASAAVLVFKLILLSSYRGNLNILKAMQKAGLKTEEDIKKIRPQVLKQAALDYQDLGEKGIAKIDSRALVTKSARSLRILWWRLDSVSGFLTFCEWGLVVAGIVFTALANDRQVFAALTLIAFAVFKLLGSFFDCKQAKEEFLDEAAFFLDSHIGKMYITDEAGAINNLRKELKGLMTFQAKNLTEAVNELRDKLVTATESTLTATAAAVRETLESVSAGAKTVLEPLAEWRLAINDSKKAHEELNLSLVKMSTAADAFKDRLSDLDGLVEGYKQEFIENNKNVESALQRLNVISADISDVIKNAGLQTDTVSAQLEYIRSNQSALKESLNQYEIALKEISVSTGEGIGKIIEYHAQNAYKTLAKEAAGEVRRAGTENTEMLTKMQDLFERLLEQSKSETALIINLKEQMELTGGRGQRTEDRGLDE